MHVVCPHRALTDPYGPLCDSVLIVSNLPTGTRRAKFHRNLPIDCMIYNTALRQHTVAKCWLLKCFGSESVRASVFQSSTPPLSRYRKNSASDKGIRSYESMTGMDNCLTATLATSGNTESIKTINSHQFRSSNTSHKAHVACAPHEDGHVAEKILRRKGFLRGGIKRTLYLVKWLGSDKQTWEPRHHFGDNNDAWLAFQQERRTRSRKRPVWDKLSPATHTMHSRRKSLSMLQQKIRKTKNLMAILPAKDTARGVSVSTNTSKDSDPVHVYLPASSNSSTVTTHDYGTTPKSAAPKMLSSVRVVKPVRLIACKTMASTGCNTMLTCLKAKDLLVEPKVGMSALESGATTGIIVGFKPREAGIRSLEDLSFLITYTDREPEFVDYTVCIQKIPQEVAQFLFKNDVFTLE